jgi:enamine deaminase RidA (YjgF/YER057c/UK114 family)
MVVVPGSRRRIAAGDLETSGARAGGQNVDGKGKAAVVEKRLINQGSSFEEEVGYSRAVRIGPWVLVSGTTGFDYQTMTISADVREQAEQALRNIADALGAADAALADVVRVRYLVTHRADFELCLAVLRRALGEARPAATMQVCGLSDPRMRIEIEVTAYAESNGSSATQI